MLLLHLESKIEFWSLWLRFLLHVADNAVATWLFSYGLSINILSKKFQCILSIVVWYIVIQKNIGKIVTKFYITEWSENIM